MVIHVDATYENGILRPSEPLDLPNATPVHVTVVPHTGHKTEDTLADDIDEDVLPAGPILTAEDVRRIIEQGAIRGTGRGLPIDFDRDDIYSDHD
jgi:predicted DNA-binding antitoxin AbrB/MazE fold protein